MKPLEEYPERMFAAQVAEWLQISVKRFYTLENEGAFDFARHRPSLGRKSWDRDRLAQWKNGTLTGLTKAS